MGKFRVLVIPGILFLLLESLLYFSLEYNINFVQRQIPLVSLSTIHSLFLLQFPVISSS
jgi:hypothetical protein